MHIKGHIKKSAVHCVKLGINSEGFKEPEILLGGLQWLVNESQGRLQKSLNLIQACTALCDTIDCRNHFRERRYKLNLKLGL